MPWYDDFDALAAARFPDLEVLREEPLARHTTFRVGGPARRMVRPASAAACAVISIFSHSSNLLFVSES